MSLGPGESSGNANIGSLLEEIVRYSHADRETYCTYIYIAICIYIIVSVIVIITNVIIIIMSITITAISIHSMQFRVLYTFTTVAKKSFAMLSIILCLFQIPFIGLLRSKFSVEQHIYMWLWFPNQHNPPLLFQSASFPNGKSPCYCRNKLEFFSFLLLSKFHYFTMTK